MDVMDIRVKITSYVAHIIYWLLFYHCTDTTIIFLNQNYLLDADNGATLFSRGLS